MGVCEGQPNRRDAGDVGHSAGWNHAHHADDPDHGHGAVATT